MCSHLLYGVKGAQPPFKKDDVILRVRPQAARHPKNLVPRPFTSAARNRYEEI